jgi:hypothetical protein
MKIMLDLGIQTKKREEYDNENYNKRYLSQLKPGEELTGEIHISSLKDGEYQGQIKHQFFVIISDTKREVKWVCGITTSIYNNNGEISIYGKQGGRVYTLIDSLNHALNNTKLNSAKSYTVVFDVFQNTINNTIETVTATTVKSGNPNAKTPNLQIIKAVLKETPEAESKEGVTVDLDAELSQEVITRLKKDNPDLYDAIDTLQLGHYNITINAIIGELKKTHKENNLNTEAYKKAREDLKQGLTNG